MAEYLAYYKSLDADTNHITGTFIFDSESKLGSKSNKSDARIKMLSLYGNDALSWTIEKIEKKKKSAKIMNGQLALDFRQPVKKKRKTARKYM